MESEILREQIEWEERRISAAFGVEKFRRRLMVDEFYYDADLGLLEIAWSIGVDDGRLWQIHIGIKRGRPTCMVAFRDEGLGECHPHYSRPECNERMLRGLYCLGIEDDVALAPLKCHLTWHEKIELRFFMPREFWPQKWLDEKEA